ncbi:hypothetical protein [Chitinimonas sp.]|uniref:hypothetical protein n=1 Tax=Chitinimonas sp. TaxID=1934313 RepID=UPI002F9591CC
MTEKRMLRPRGLVEGDALGPLDGPMGERRRQWRLLALLFAMAALCYYGWLLMRARWARGRGGR